MRTRLLGIGLVVLLMVLWVGLPMLLAQSRELSDPDLKWEEPPIFVGFPDHNEGDDEGDDEASDCPPYPAMVPKTGVTECWPDQAPYIPIDCAGTGEDGEYQEGVAVDPRFTENGDGTVTDDLTGLIWLQDANCSGIEWSWRDALSHVNTLADGSCGLTDGSVAGDWRLPNVKELQSLNDYSQVAPAIPAGHPFSGLGVEWGKYWSSTSRVNAPWDAWVVQVRHGNVYIAPKGFTYFVWPVRGPE